MELVSAILEGVIDQVVEDFPQEGICKDFQVLPVNINRNGLCWQR